jgi:hypothetical protein
VNSKEKTFKPFVPNCVQEFDLWIQSLSVWKGSKKGLASIVFDTGRREISSFFVNYAKHIHALDFIQ